MRMRKKPWARPELEGCDFFVINPKEYKGKWKEFFGNDKPIYLELGCGKGTFMAVHASENPDINYIAIDIKDEVLGLAKRNIEKAYEEKNRKTDNVKLMAQEIGLISEILSEEDVVSRIYINFCNPWPKEKHKKRRLTHMRQLEQYKTFLKSEGEIYFKTDDDELFEESLEYFNEAGFRIKYITYDLHNSDVEGNVQTEHEKMFSEQGIKIKFLIAMKDN
ncbi:MULTISPECIES: tRNA (guanosine(46)-N7)-methyltransferase TrmB [Clostridium]|jgi:tRNA (guanine-N(7)-)-methyltransferase (EC 2.1.1.33)|uniref:tRNA (guanine-N(7)-)-methyltransferase n=4 Tax=Clostridium TaxID=1485 RepID=TRMB_CLOB8|nr:MULTISPECIES: tRNA (guanosine(46)-N7)-methyltransferase TrmB [Clostridium]A6LRN7.1 RecName: Full=tRNA (guanine-N(7)-)-methyltransferase; AltName: Full=tRNA (guanine(46)-N(7))-methyltransferase; AltName: Full=tRNA(m7G46)-methyltransferase [Clostridium beijerinckii NCIMB 8052]ABR33017.1 tRNA (guanine-N(7)-)-methyltransferase [Clostridium beijerinckii NCIMB 8052]AIU00217.1 tRNA (guanine-N(7)-)-methyltransferase [Clostridium beijerinckii ATCC 35702]AJG97537.1 tRNA (guanine-N7)-methyltransferase 